MKKICYCAKCAKMVYVEDNPVQNPIYKHGGLDSIEIAHRECRPEWSIHDDHFDEKSSDSMA